MLKEIERKILAGGRVEWEEAVWLSEHADLYDLGGLAHTIRMHKHPDLNVTYVADRNINYSNICSCGCRFCAFFVAPGMEEKDGGYVLTHEELAAKIEETLDLGGTQILMQGGHHPDLPFSFYEEMLRFIKANYDIHIHAFSPPGNLVLFRAVCNASGPGHRKITCRRVRLHSWWGC